MSGIYIHIPFCRKKCIYCDFYSEMMHRGESARYIRGILQEYELRRDEISDPIRTIYVGGGTPSILSEIDLLHLLKGIKKGHDILEFTVEVNPDDVTDSLASVLDECGVNRVSMGVQSYVDGELAFLNRRHDSKKALTAIDILRRHGIRNLSIDLIYGIPGQTQASWKNSLDVATKSEVSHISTYNLTYEYGTQLTRLRDKGQIEECPDDVCIDMFDMLVDILVANGYEQYEISNFAREGKYSMHNSSYWNFTPYMGLGASAHSFDGKVRRYNVSDYRKYLSFIEGGNAAFKIEHESVDELYNEWMMTRLRTKWGADLSVVALKFGMSYQRHAYDVLERYVRSGHVVIDGQTARLTHRGIMLSDMIFRDLFVV